jgi:hypothetical protein
MLDAHLSVEQTEANVRFVLAVENGGDQPTELTFSDARRAEFVVRVDGEERWRSSRDQLFAQVLRTETLAPGERREYDAEWTAPSPGHYTVEGYLATPDADARAEATFSVGE